MLNNRVELKLLQFNSIVLTKKSWNCLCGIVEQFTKATKQNAHHNTNYVILDAFVSLSSTCLLSSGCLVLCRQTFALTACCHYVVADSNSAATVLGCLTCIHGHAKLAFWRSLML